MVQWLFSWRVFHQFVQNGSIGVTGASADLDDKGLQLVLALKSEAVWSSRDGRFNELFV